MSAIEISAQLGLFAVGLLNFDMVLGLSSTAGRSWLDVFHPAGVEQQPVANLVGAVSFYLLAIVIITSYVRRTIGRKSWKAMHRRGQGRRIRALDNWDEPVPVEWAGT
jgi:DMSO/TMAO reductase YedYZ heme-binding membrane subunit